MTGVRGGRQTHYMGGDGVLDAKGGARGELIPDYALPADEEDRFDHQDFVNRLLAVVEHVSVDHASANIALFGAWGSGKSGIANRLRAEISRDQRFHYTYFDAFKFARLPLLRNFVAQVADDLLEDEALARRYKSELYEGTARISMRLPLVDGWRRAGLLTLVIALGVIFGFVLGIWLFDTGRWHQAAGHFFTLLIAVAGLTALFSYFSTTRTKDPLESDEEFEAIFKRLLKELGVDGEGFPRLVVFVDELDRCAPSEVASTLESIRTFLGVKGCIFIVAADPQVLEYALTQHLRQATPPNLTNPYYSAGSAYLDKIFQYQLSFPPLRSRRLTNYALELVGGRNGVWADPDVDVEEVVSVLLPTHVNSPRRVKVLLNGFVLSYGVARERAGRDSISALSGRAAELAKLVCLRAEFPLFAQELSLDDRLCEAVLRAARAREADVDPEGILGDLPLDVRRRAISFAAGQLPVSQLLTGVSAPRGVAYEIGAEGRRADREDEGDDTEVDPDEEGEPGLGREVAKEATVQQRYSVQLVRYLEKTEFVDGPRRDLVHLESAGAVWGLDPQLADDLERDALDNRPEAVVARLADLPDADYLNALLMLGRQAGESVGADADNTMTCLLGAAQAAEISLDPIAPQLIGDLVAYDERRGLRPGALPGALALALAAGHEELVDRVMAREELSEDNSLTFAILSQADRLPRHSQRLVELLAVGIYEHAGPTRQVLHGIDQALARTLLGEASAVLSDQMKVRAERAEEAETRGEESIDDRGWVDSAVAEVGALCELLLDDEQGLAELGAVPLYAVETEEAREARLAFLARVEQLGTPELSAAVLGDIDGWGMRRTEDQLRVLDPSLLADIPTGPAAMDHLGAHVWRERTVEATDLGESLRQEIEAIIGAGVAPAGDLTIETVGKDFVRGLSTEEDLKAFEIAERFAHAMADVGLISYAVIATFSLRTVRMTFEAPAPEPLPPSLVNELRGSIRWLGGDAEPDVLRELLAVLHGETWLPDPDRYAAELEVLAALAGQEGIVVPSLTELQQAVDADRADQEAVGIWVEHFAAGPGEAFAAIRDRVSAPAGSLLESLAKYAAGLDRGEMADLNRRAIEDAFELAPGEEFFTATHLADANEGVVAEAIVELFQHASNESQREVVLDIWEWADPQSKKPRRRLIEEVFSSLWPRKASRPTTLPGVASSSSRRPQEVSRIW
jgi:hypothetical protein